MNTTRIMIWGSSGGWQPLEIGDDAVVINKNITDVMDITKKRGDYSKTIKIKGTENNNLILANAYNISEDKLFNPKEGVYCEIWRNEIREMYGKLYLLSINDNYGSIEYECIAVSTLKDIFDKLSVVKFSDLYYYDTFDFTASYINAQTFNPISSAKYPIFFTAGMFGHYCNLPNINFKNFKPIIFILDILERAFNIIGYTIDGSSIIYDVSKVQNKMFRYLVLFARQDWTTLDATTITNNKLICKNSTNYLSVNIANTPPLIMSSIWSPIVQFVEDTVITDIGGHLSGGKITYINPFTITFTINLKIEVKYTWGGSGAAPTPPASISSFVTLYVRIGTQLYSSSALPISLTYNSGTGYYECVVNHTAIKSFTPVTSEYVEYQVQYQNMSLYLTSWCLANFKVTQLSTSVFKSQMNDRKLGDTNITVKSAFEDMTMGNFVSQFFKLFNLFYSFPSENVIKIDSYDTFYDTNRTNVLDISANVDETSKQQVIINDYYNRYYSLAYSNEGGYFNDNYKTLVKNRTYGDAYIDTGFEMKKDTTEVKFDFEIPCDYLNSVVFPAKYDIDNSGQVTPVDYKLMIGLWNGHLTTSLSLSTTVNIIDTEILSPSTIHTALTGGLPIASQTWINTDESGYADKNDYANNPDFDLSIDTPKIIYYEDANTIITNRNIYYSFHYKWLMNFTDKNSLIYKVKLKVESYWDLKLDKVYFFDNNYWILLKINDWNITYNIANCDFVKIIDTSIIEFTKKTFVSGFLSGANRLANPNALPYVPTSIPAANNRSVELSTGSIAIMVDYTMFNATTPLVIDFSDDYVVAVFIIVDNGYTNTVTATFSGTNKNVKIVGDFVSILKTQTGTTLTISCTATSTAGSMRIKALSM